MEGVDSIKAGGQPKKEKSCATMVQYRSLGMVAGADFRNRTVKVIRESFNIGKITKHHDTLITPGMIRVYVLYFYATGRLCPIIAEGIAQLMFIRGMKSDQVDKFGFTLHDLCVELNAIDNSFIDRLADKLQVPIVIQEDHAEKLLRIQKISSDKFYTSEPRFVQHDVSVNEISGTVLKAEKISEPAYEFGKRVGAELSKDTRYFREIY